MKLIPATPEHQNHPVAEGEPETELSPDLVHLARSLHQEFDQRLGSELVEHEIRLNASKFKDARVRAFVPLFVRRFSGAALRDDCLHPPLEDQAELESRGVGPSRSTDAGTSSNPATI